MTTIEVCETHKTATGWAAVVGTAVTIVEKAGNYYRSWSNRRELYRLSELNDRELSDIGLSRSDLFIARDLPASIDPTARLGAFAERNCRKI